MKKFSRKTFLWKNFWWKFFREKSPLCILLCKANTKQSTKQTQSKVHKAKYKAICVGRQKWAKCSWFHEQKTKMFAQKRSEKMWRDGREKCWPQESDAKNQKKNIYTTCRVYQLTYMPWLPARPIAALCINRKEIFRAGDMLASHISRSACRVLLEMAGALVLWLPDPCIYQKTRARRGKGASLFIFF